MTNHSPQPTNVRWGIVALAAGSSWMLYLHRYAFALMKPKLAEEWKLGETELGMLDSVFSLFYSVFQIPLGVAVDVWGVRFILTAMLLVGALGLGLHAWAGTSGQMWYARAILGVGQSAVYAALTRISRQWYPPNMRTTLQGLVGIFAGRVGGLSAYMLFGWLLLGVLDFDWRIVTQIFVVLGIAHALLFVSYFRNTPEEHWQVNPTEAALIAGEASGSQPSVAPARMTVREMLRSLTPRGLINLVFLNVQSVLSTFADNLYSNWIPLFLWKVHDLKAQEMGVYSSLPLLGGAVAGILGGYLNDVCISRTGNRRWSRSGVAFVGKGMAAVWMLVALMFYDQPYLFCGILFLVKLFGDWSITTLVGVVTDIGGPATASVYAFNNTVAGIGSVCAPLVFGFLAEYYGWRVVFMTVAVTYLLCALSWLLVNCTIPLVEEQSQHKII